MTIDEIPDKFKRWALEQPGAGPARIQPMWEAYLKGKEGSLDEYNWKDIEKEIDFLANENFGDSVVGLTHKFALGMGLKMVINKMEKNKMDKEANEIFLFLKRYSEGG